MASRLGGKRAIVTGAASGIGRASAILFAAEGAAVLAADVSDGVEQTAAAIREAGGKAIALQMDAGDEAQVQAMIERCVGELGGLEVLFANAGISGGLSTVTDTSVELFEQVLRVNLIGVFLAIKHASRHMVQSGGGSIVATASVAGLRAHAGGIPYSASKAGVISLVQTCAAQLRGTGIRVNAICPGLIETGMTRPLFELARARGSEGRIGQLTPLERYGHPEEIAAMALLLASDEGSYVNGQAIAVDGGLSSSHPFVPPRKPREVD
jgi:NAD(P)-dependent dehydrogenase (short-subunit alcohol dehydrogenase family)